MTSNPPAPECHCQHMRALLLAIDTEDWTELSAMLSEDCCYLAPGMRRLRGRAAILDYYRHTRPVAAGCHAIERACALADEATVIGTFSGTTRDGDDVALRFTDWANFYGDLIIAREVFTAPWRKGAAP